MFRSHLDPTFSSMNKKKNGIIRKQANLFMRIENKPIFKVQGSNPKQAITPVEQYQMQDNLKSRTTSSFYERNKSNQRGGALQKENEANFPIIKEYRMRRVYLRCDNNLKINKEKTS